jgi:hypothetical protein
MARSLPCLLAKPLLKAPVDRPLQEPRASPKKASRTRECALAERRTPLRRAPSSSRR